MIKETKYIRFEEVKIKKANTKIVNVINKTSETRIGTISWFTRWRRYCFFPANATVFDSECLESINGLIVELMDKRRKK